MEIYEIVFVIGYILLMFLGAEAIEKCFTGKKDADKYLIIVLVFGFSLVLVALIMIIV